MTEAMTRGAAFVAAPGPDLLRIPAEPARLRQAAQGLGELADHLQRAGDALGQSEGRQQQDRSGHTTSALVSVTRWNGGAMGRDATMLRDLAEAVGEEARVLGDAQSHDLPSLRQRWDHARQDFVEDLRQAAQAADEARQQAQQEAQHRTETGGHAGGHGGHGGGHGGGQGGHAAWAPADAQFAQAQPVPHDVPDPHALMAHLDDQLLRPHEDLFRSLGHGVDLGGGGGHEAFIADARVERAIGSYRQSVRALLEEFADLVRRVQQLERHVDEKAQRPEGGRDEDGQGAGFALAAGGAVSGTQVLRELVRDLRDGAQAHDQAHDRVAPLASQLRDGMLPARDRDGDGFRSDWQRHFARRTERLRTVAAKVDDVLDKFERLDAECAAAIRQH